MVVVLLNRNGSRSQIEVAKPEMTIRLQSTRASQDYDLHSVDAVSRLIYLERAK